MCEFEKGIDKTGVNMIKYRCCEGEGKNAHPKTNKTNNQKEKTMNANQKLTAINKALAKDGTNFDEVVRAHQSYFTHLADYLKKHEHEGKKTDDDYETEIKWGLCETASEFNNNGTMKWLVEFLVGNCDIAKGERDKWLDYVKVVTTTDNLKRAKAMVNWDMKYHREAFDQICDLIFK